MPILLTSMCVMYRYKGFLLEFVLLPLNTKYIMVFLESKFVVSSVQQSQTYLIINE